MILSDECERIDESQRKGKLSFEKSPGITQRRKLNMLQDQLLGDT